MFPFTLKSVTFALFDIESIFGVRSITWNTVAAELRAIANISRYGDALATDSAAVVNPKKT